MQVPLHIFILLTAYLFGSLPSAVWIGKIFYGIDVREHGSGNAGATNVFRVIGKRAAVPVLICDILKGWIAVKLSFFVADMVGKEEFISLQLTLGAAAIIGHIFPVLASFKGGKGVATLLGVTLAIHPLSAVVGIFVFVFILLVSHYVSLGSILAGLSFPVSLMILFPASSPTLVLFSLLTPAILLVTHQKNIERLLKKEEAKIYLFRKKKESEMAEK
ncbi:MAG: glycerol-3-phosphate 1-O-acyltransferase PlsY [Bacteroidetes bacterium]|nr:glycerol-3-phosphate 1-O-acyltransferase PlsY [Bacteroidota bacterium]